MKRKLKISILGRGNAGTHLALALEGKADVTVVNPHCPEDVADDTDICLVSVKDDAVKDVVTHLRGFRGIIAHTSGSVPMEVLDGVNERHGVFYPLQTFSKNVSLDYSEIPVFTEADTPETEAILSELAELMGCRHFHADSGRRKRLHIASVFACNFTNHLYAIANDLLMADGMDITVLFPLIRETVRKLTDTADPAANQTGPAARGDTGIIRRHLEMLKDNPGYAEIYMMLSEDIMRSAASEKNNHNTQKSAT